MHDTHHIKDRIRANDENVGRLVQVYDLILRAFRNKHNIAGRGQFGDRTRPANGEDSTGEGTATL